jgi:hypothetical protein
MRCRLTKTEIQLARLHGSIRTLHFPPSSMTRIAAAWPRSDGSWALHAKQTQGRRISVGPVCFVVQRALMFEFPRRREFDNLP